MFKHCLKFPESNTFHGPLFNKTELSIFLAYLYAKTWWTIQKLEYFYNLSFFNSSVFIYSWDIFPLGSVDPFIYIFIIYIKLVNNLCLGEKLTDFCQAAHTLGVAG